MNPKNTLVLLIIAIVLVAVAIVLNRREQQVIGEAAAPRREVFKGVTSSTLTRIEIRTPDGTTTTLTRKDDAWFTDPEKGYKADRNYINGLVGAIEKTIEGEVRSANPDSHPDFEVTESSATQVKIYGKSGLLADLLIGKAGSSFFTTFVRKAGEKEVVEANASLTYIFNKPEGWRDKAIFEFAADSVKRISAEGTTTTFEVEKIDGKWRLTKPEQAEAQEAKITPITSVLATLRATGFVDLATTQAPATMGLDPPAQKITIVREDRSTSPPKEVTEILLIGNREPEKNAYLVKRADAPDIYTISDYQGNLLMPAVNDLKPPAPAPEPAADTGTTETTQTVETETTAPTTVSDEATTPSAADLETTPVGTPTPVDTATTFAMTTAPLATSESPTTATE